MKLATINVILGWFGLVLVIGGIPTACADPYGADQDEADDGLTLELMTKAKYAGRLTSQQRAKE